MQIVMENQGVFLDKNNCPLPSIDLYGNVASTQNYQTEVVKPTTEESSDDVEARKMFIGGISWETNNSELQMYFSKFGTVEDASVQLDPDTNRPRGFAFVTFKDLASVQRVLQGGPHVLSGRTIDPKKARNQNSLRGGTPRKIYVRNSKGLTQEQLRQYFSQFGTIANMDCPMYHNDDGSLVRREYCFIEYELQASVEAACKKEVHPIGGCNVEAKRFVAKERGNYSAVGPNRPGLPYWRRIGPSAPPLRPPPPAPSFNLRNAPYPQQGYRGPPPQQQQMQSPQPHGYYGNYNDGYQQPGGYYTPNQQNMQNWNNNTGYYQNQGGYGDATSGSGYYQNQYAHQYPHNNYKKYEHYDSGPPGEN